MESSKIRSVFAENVNSVIRLAEFDRLVLDFAIKHLEKLYSRLREHHGIENPRLTVEATLNQIKNIRKNDSLRPQYEEIFNQCVVLLVSYFGSAMGDLFRAFLPIAITASASDKLLREELKISIAELKSVDLNLSSEIGDIFIRKRNISFQDMKSISRAFGDFLNVSLNEAPSLNDIILGGCPRIG